MESIEITIDKQGKIEVNAHGFTGSACTEATRKYIQSLGLNRDEIKKGEYWQEQTQEQSANL